MEIFDKNGKALNIIDLLSSEAMTLLSGANRVEIIDEHGRSYINWKPANQTFLILQDEGRTLKIFIKQQQTPKP